MEVDKRESPELDKKLKELHERIEEAREMYQEYERKARGGKYEDPPIVFLMGIYATQRRTAELGRMLVEGKLEEVRQELPEFSVQVSKLRTEVRDYQQPLAAPPEPPKKKEKPTLDWV